jgi:hypothetical protein
MTENYIHTTARPRGFTPHQQCLPPIMGAFSNTNVFSVLQWQSSGKESLTRKITATKVVTEHPTRPLTTVVRTSPK